MAQAALIREGDTVIFDENGEHKAMVKIRANAQVRVGKGSVPAKQFIGVPYGAVFTFSQDAKSAERVETCPVGEWAQGQVTAVERNNAELFDRNTDNQKLSANDIAAMKEAGKDGKDIINALISNSATFQTKTEFSQEKYKKKKAKKYLIQVTLRRPTARWICQAYYDKKPDRVFHLRPDTLAIALSLANVSAGARVLVVDGCVDMVAAAVAERLAGSGTLVVAQLDHPTSLDTVKSLNLSKEEMACVHAVRLGTLLSIKAESEAQQANGVANGQVAMNGAHNNTQPMQVDSPADPATAPATDAAAPTDAATAADASTSVAGATQATDVAASDPAAKDTAEGGIAEASSAAGAEHVSGRRAHAAAERAGLREAVRLGFDCCILASPQYDPIQLLDKVFPLLNPSAAFAAYSPSPQPLAECYAQLQARKQAVLLQLQESWLRPYQVLPGRTHPHMTCSGTGGFLLSGITVVADTPSATTQTHTIKAATHSTPTGAAAATTAAADATAEAAAAATDAAAATTPVGAAAAAAEVWDAADDDTPGSAGGASQGRGSGGRKQRGGAQGGRSSKRGRRG